MGNPLKGNAHFFGNDDVTWGDVGLQFLTAGQSTSAVSSNIAKRQAEEEKKAAEERVRREQERRNGYLAQIRDLFGVGTGEKSGENGRRLADALRQYYQDSLQSNLGAVNQGYGAASRVSRQNLARAGQLGSSLDTQSKSSNLSDYLRGRQSAVQRAAQQKSGLAASLERMRTGLENGVSSGSLTNPDFTNIANEQLSLLESARKNVQPQVVGNLFRQAGAGYYNGRVQEGSGNRGLQSFGIGGDSRGGSYS